MGTDHLTEKELDYIKEFRKSEEQKGFAKKLGDKLYPKYEALFSKVNLKSDSTEAEYIKYKKSKESKSLKDSFCVRWGCRYPIKDNCGLLYVGRATNAGCDKADINDCQAFFKDGFNRDDQTEWMCKKKNDSPFRRIIMKIVNSFLDDSKTVKLFFGDKKPDPWSYYIAWSNLYKVTPKKRDGDKFSGNPGSKLKKVQENECHEILKAEIDALSPKVILFVTNFYWSQSFLRYLFPDGDLKKYQLFPKDISKPTYQWGKKKKYECLLYKYTTSNNGESLIIVSEHPQGKPEKEHVQCLQQIFKDYNISYEDLFGE